jgi:hypothetical protein
MKYTTLGRRPPYVSGDRPEMIYVIPVSSDPEDYRIIYPNTLKKNIVELLLDKAIQIMAFESCSENAVWDVREYLKNQLEQKNERHSSRINTGFICGIGLAVLGLLNFTFPDPLPLIDELLMMIGGGVWAFRSARAKRLLPQFRERVQQAENWVRDLEAFSDPLLTRIYGSVKAKQEPQQQDLEQTTLDRIEAESQWFVKYLNIRDMIESESVTTDEVREVIEALEDIIPLKTLVRLERSYERSGMPVRLKRLRDKVKSQLEMSDDALAVYCGFYRSACEYFKIEGQKL